MTARVFDVTLETTYRVTINDDSVLRRVAENHDDAGVPQPRERGGTGWQDSFYELDEEGVLYMLARCIGVMGWRFLSLEGWADLQEEAVEVRLHDDELVALTEIAGVRG